MTDLVLDSTILPSSESPIMAHSDAATVLCLVHDFFQSQFELKNAAFPLIADEFLHPDIIQTREYQRIRDALVKKGQFHLQASEERLRASLQAIVDRMLPPYTEISFNQLSASLFSEGISWSYILTYFVVSAELAYQAHLRGFAAVADVAHWTARYIIENLAVWIADNGGWNAYPLTEADDEEADEREAETQRMRNLERLYGVGAAALGVISLGLFLSRS